MSENQMISSVVLMVADYDEALNFYTHKLGFECIADTAMGPGKRWVQIAPPGNSSGTRLVLARATNDSQRAAIGNQTGGRVFLFIQTPAFWADYERLQAQGVHFLEAPREEPHGTVVIFEDLYGNKLELVQYH
ncbi:MAG: VOC family protein [Candidatus Sericytochromatia bacterium]|nr:VOC family protein [Candidatus Sericytochromatia bacterium]